MIGETAMVSDGPSLHSVSPGFRPLDPEAARLRTLNEKTAIICGMADLLLDSNGSLDQEVARAALESIKRHAAGLRELFQND